MDFSTLILGTILVLLIAAPIGLLIRSGKKRTEKMQKLLKELAQKYELNFDFHETWNDKMLAIDSKSRWLIYARKPGNESGEQLIDLSKIQKCVINKKEKKQKRGESAILRVELQLFHKHQPGHIDCIVLYDIDQDEAVEGGYHYEIARRWQQSISNGLNF